MQSIKKFVFYFVLLSINNLHAYNANDKTPDLIQDFLQETFKQNSFHVKYKLNNQLQKIQNSQTPRATILSCSDSRVQSETISATVINDVFYVRNIGNQVTTSIGSIQYGINYLKTPVLLIIGHVDCGAIKAAVTSYKSKFQDINKELKSLKIPKKTSLRDANIYNIHNQVLIALKIFKEKVLKGELIIIGAVYDFKNEYNQGYNRLIVININGEKNPQIIKNNQYIKKIDNLPIGIKNINL